MMRRIARFEALALLAAIVLPASAQTIREDLWEPSSSARVVTIHAGVAYIGGDFTQVGPRTGSSATVSTATGRVVDGFDTDGSVEDLAPDGAGGWYLGGSFTSVLGVPRSNLARVLSNGSVASWDPNANGAVHEILVLGPTVYVGGMFTSVGGQFRSRIAAIDGAGLATAWSPSANGTVDAIIPSGSGTTLYVGGEFTSIGGFGRNRIAEIVVASGSATSWNPNANGAVSALHWSGSSVYVGGAFTSIGGATRNRLAAVHPVTGAATAFDPNADRAVYSLTMNGAIVYAGGAFETISGQARLKVAALDALSGAPQAWNVSIISSGTSTGVNAMAISGSTLYMGGRFGTVAGQPRRGLAAVNLATGVLSPWISDTNNEQVFDISLGGGVLGVGGGFHGVGGVSRNRIAAIDLATGEATSWDPNANGSVRAILVHDSKVFVGGVFTAIGGFTRNRLAAFDRATGGILTWNPNANGNVHALAPGSGIVYAGGDFTNVGGIGRNRLVSLESGTAAVTAWNPNANNSVEALLIDGSTLFAGGSFSNVGGQTRLSVAAVNAISGAILSWNVSNIFPTTSATHALARSGATLYMGGSFTTVNLQTRNRAASVSAATGLVTSWNPNANSEVRALCVDGSSAFLGGDFTFVGGQPRTALAAVDANSGALLPWNVTLTGTSPATHALAVDAPSIFAAGSFSTADPAHSYFIEIRDAALSAPIVEILDSPLGVSVIPNPARSDLAIEFELPRSSRTQIAIFDVRGRRVAQFPERVLPEGRHRVNWNREGALGPVSSGVYLIRVEIAELSETTRVVLLR